MSHWGRGKKTGWAALGPAELRQAQQPRSPARRLKLTAFLRPSRRFHRGALQSLTRVSSGIPRASPGGLTE